MVAHHHPSVGVAVITLLRVLVVTAQYGPDPEGVPADFACGWRQLAFEYATSIRPDASDVIKEALQLSHHCHGHPASTNHAEDRADAPVAKVRAGISTGTHTDSIAAATAFVDAGAVDDVEADGSQTRPFRTIGAGVQSLRGRSGRRAVIVRAGTYFEPTLELTSADSGLTISSADKEAVWVSGGVPLREIKWRQHRGRIWRADVSALGLDNIATLRVDGRRLSPARYPNADPETEFWPTGYLISRHGYDAQGDWQHLTDWPAPARAPPAPPSPSNYFRASGPTHRWRLAAADGGAVAQSGNDGQRHMGKPRVG